MNKPTTDNDQKKIVRLYAAFGAGLILSLVPLGVAALISTLLVLGVLVVAYVLRTDAEEDSLIANHTTFIIRTIWIGSFLALVTLTVASIYLFKMLDNTPLQPCIDDIFQMASQMTVMDMNALEHFTNGQCWNDYWHTNLTTLITAGVITAGPVVLYFIVRYVRGLTRATGGYRVANPKAWF